MSERQRCGSGADVTDSPTEQRLVLDMPFVDNCGFNKQCKKGWMRRKDVVEKIPAHSFRLDEWENDGPSGAK